MACVYTTVDSIAKNTSSFALDSVKVVLAHTIDSVAVQKITDFVWLKSGSIDFS
jgi:hypothetical protein